MAIHSTFLADIQYRLSTNNLVNLGVLFTILTAILFGYVVYERYFHPLSIYPGPFLASLTDLWQVVEFIQGRQPYHLTDLHAKYGEIVRYGPDKLSITGEDAVHTIYVKNAKTMPKTEFYNPFGKPGSPNLFNIRDQEVHAPRRRHVLKVFSPQAVETYEPLIDKHIDQLRSKIRAFALATHPTPFDIKHVLWCFMSDVIMDLVYGESWNLLANTDAHGAIDIHALTLWGSFSGAWTMGEPIIKFLIALIPHPFAYKVFWQNIQYAIKMGKLVEARVAELDRGTHADRKDLMTKMILERKDKSGYEMSTSEIAVECYGFLIAGVHPPTSAMTLLLYHLLHNPSTLEKATAEIHQHLDPISSDSNAYSNSAIEQNLPYLRHCVKESFRLTPSFTMPLPRRVEQKEGVLINGHVVPKGTSIAVSNHAFHHNAKLWPHDHNAFNPSRWENADPRLTELSKLMMHFGAGPRQCIGKVLAVTMIQKVVATLLSEFRFELADQNEQQKAMQGAFYGKTPHLESVGISDIEGSLFIRARLTKSG